MLTFSEGEKKSPLRVAWVNCLDLPMCQKQVLIGTFCGSIQKLVVCFVSRFGTNPRIQIRIQNHLTSRHKTRPLIYCLKIWKSFFYSFYHIKIRSGSGFFYLDNCNRIRISTRIRDSVLRHKYIFTNEKYSSTIFYKMTEKTCYSYDSSWFLICWTRYGPGSVLGINLNEVLI